VPPTGEPNIDGEIDWTVLSIMSKSSTCMMVDTSIDARNVSVEDIVRASGGK
jgi:hypothetical protein